MVKKAIYQRDGDPYIYLHVMGEWYCYDPASKPLGSGSMGTVYRGYRVRDGEPMAVKRVIDAYANNPMIRARAKQEASLAFRHPNLIEMIGYCEYAPDTGPIFLISKYVKGMHIDEYLDGVTDASERISKACNAVCQVLNALEYVHSRGVIHRDIKPSNIMVEEDYNVRLMDLGIARMNDGNSFSKLGFIGTPRYAAPEQILREKTGIVQINASTDIYALGITFYELLTGENPFDSKVEADILMRQLRDSLPNNKAIPKRLMQVIWKATEKEQAKRYRRASDFKAAIHEAIQPPVSLLARIKSWFSK